MKNKIINPALANVAEHDISVADMRESITKFSDSIETLTKGVANDAWSLHVML